MEDREINTAGQTECVDIVEIVHTFDLNLDPKRFSSKFRELRRSIEEIGHFALGDVMEIVPTRRFTIRPEKIYKYVEIERVGVGEYDYTECRGWQLASRAKLQAQRGDIFIAHLWSSAGKWFIAAGDCKDVVVTNGCAHLRMKKEHSDLLPDVAIGLCSELFSVQIRALATGSDGLAEITDDDILTIKLPKLKPQSREQVSHHLKQVLSGEARFAKYASSIIDKTTRFPIPPARKSHCALV